MRAQNPFATRHTRPGATPFIAWHDRNAARVIEKLQRHHDWGQIVGPHGSGKTTLVRELIPMLQAAGKSVDLFELHDRQRSLTRPLPTPPESLAIIDGFEQLGFWSRWKVRRHCRRHQIGLLITTHRPQPSLPIVATTSVELELLEKIVAQLMHDDVEPSIAPPSHALLSRLLDQHRGNLREVLMDLYDWYASATRDEA